MRKNTNGLPGAFVSAMVIAGLCLGFAALMLGLWFLGGEEPLGTGMIVVTALIYVAIAVGVIIALVQRVREVRRGEEDEARKY